MHGGTKGFDKVVWKGEEVKGKTAVKFTYVSKPDGEEGYPGNLTATVEYTLSDENELTIKLRGDDRQGDAGQPDATTATSTWPARASATFWTTN